MSAYDRRLIKTASERVFLRYASGFNVGDFVLYGKWKNGRAKITGFSTDPRGNVTVILQPVDRDLNPHKAPKTLSLYTIWPMPTQ